MNEVVTQVVLRRQKAMNIFLLIEKLRRRKKQEIHKRLWSRSWLLRRDQQQNVLNMLFEELGYVNVTGFIRLILGVLTKIIITRV